MKDVMPLVLIAISSFATDGSIGFNANFLSVEVIVNPSPGLTLIRILSLKVVFPEPPLIKPSPATISIVFNA